MLLPLFPLPSRPTELIQFRQPNIADAMRFNCKRKLTAVCSHQTRIGNLDAHLI